MIDNEVPLTPGLLVRHDEGLLYRIDGTGISTVGYEEAHRLGGVMIRYTQLEDGTMPAGTEYDKDEEGFREHFTVEVKRTQYPQELRF